MNAEKLTHRFGTRYDRDRNMSESATLEKEKDLPSEKTELLDPELLKSWDTHLRDADVNQRDAIFRRIKEGKAPDAGLDQAALRDMSQEEVEKKFDAIRQRYEIKTPEDLHKFTGMMESYKERVDKGMDELGDDSLPPGEVLRHKNSWQDFGWSDEGKNRVRNDLKQVLSGLRLEDWQAEIIMEIFLSQGLKPSDLTADAIRAKLQQAKHEVRRPDDENNILNPRALAQAKHDENIATLRLLGIEHKYIKQYILTDIYIDDNDRDVDYSAPRNIEELAWQIMHTPGRGYNGWGIKGELPLLEMRIVKLEKDEIIDGKKCKKGDIDPRKSRYYVNTSNMVRWARYTMYTDYDRDREDPKDFFSSIALKKRYPLSFNEMLLNPDQYFVSEDGKSNYKGLMLEWYTEAAVFSTVRAWDVAYRGVIGNPDELAKVFREMYNTKNLMTRGALGHNILGLMTTMPFDFKGRKEGDWESDSMMGAAWIDIYRCYDSLMDYENLKKILGEGSKFFTQRGWEDAILEVAKEKMSATGITDLKTMFGMETHKYFEKAFDKNGEISTMENRRNFIKFLNIFGNKMPSAELEFTVRAALRGAVAEKYGQEVYVKDANGSIVYETVNGVKKPRKKHAFVTDQGRKKGERIEDRVEDDWSLKIAEAMSWSLARPFGALAKNDPDAVGHDWMARVYNTQLMRQKYPHRGDKFGNEFNMMQFKRTGMDVLNGIVTEAPHHYIDSEGNKKYRNKTPMEVMIELSEFRTIFTKKLREYEYELQAIDPSNAEERARKQKQIDDFKTESNKRYQNMSQQMSFNQRTLSNYWEDHLSFGIDLYKELVSSEEIPFEKFTDYTPFGGVRFKTEEFQKEIQDKWIHKIRYMIETYPSINLNQKIRILDQTATNDRHWHEDDGHGHHRNMQPVYHEVTMGEAMFGHEMLNRPQFWKMDDRGKPIHLRDRNGKKIKGKYVIDWEKVQDQKQAVWKQWFMMKLAGDFYSHRALHANDVRYNLTYYQNAVEAIGRIAGDLMQDEFGMKDTVSHEAFFNKQDIAWLKRMARIESFDLYWRAVLKDIFTDDKPEEGIGLLLALSIAMKGIIADKV
jgi:hypothetical protein